MEVLRKVTSFVLADWFPGERNCALHDLPAALATLVRPGEAVEWPVWAQAGPHRLGGRLCAIRKSQEAIQRAE
jgi:hypothetical protein